MGPITSLTVVEFEKTVRMVKNPFDLDGTGCMLDIDLEDLLGSAKQSAAYFTPMVMHTFAFTEWDLIICLDLILLSSG